MIFWYLNRKTNRWFQAELDQQLIDQYKIKFVNRLDLPGHKGQEIPTLDMVGYTQRSTAKPHIFGHSRRNDILLAETQINLGAHGIMTGVMQIKVHQRNAECAVDNRHATVLVDQQGIPAVSGDTINRLNAQVAAMNAEPENPRTKEIEMYNSSAVSTVTVQANKFTPAPNPTATIKSIIKNNKPAHDPIKKFEDKVKRLTVGIHGKAAKLQQTKYVMRKDGKRLCYINRDGLAVSITRNFGGGYTKTIGVGLNKDGTVNILLGTKQRNLHFKRGNKDVYTDDEQRQIDSYRGRIASESEVHATAPGLWDVRPQTDKKYVISVNKVNSPTYQRAAPGSEASKVPNMNKRVLNDGQPTITNTRTQIPVLIQKLVQKPNLTIK